ncbi:hypothetical protein B0H16DRAFT_1255504, partial [Mycena metata]
PFLVVIDGLDECDGQLVQSRIVKIILQMSGELQLPLRFLICSRPEPHIREAFQSVSGARFRYVVLDENLDPDYDITRYLHDRLGEIQRKRLPHQNLWPSVEDITTLVKNASGQFIYAATVVKFVGDEFYLPAERLQLVLHVS